MPLPVVTIASNVTICSGDSATVTFTGTPNAIVTYTVNGGANQTITLNASGTASVTNTYTSTTTFALVSIATTGTPSCSQAQSGSVVITVVPPPTVTLTVDNSNVCPNGSATVTFTGTPNGTVTYTVNGGANQTITLNSAGTATVTNTYSATTTFTLVSITTLGPPNCSQPQTSSITITVLPLPVVAIASNATICFGGSATVTFTGTPNATVTYTINGGANQTIAMNGAGTATITNTYTATTTFSLVSVATSGTPSCSQLQTGSLVITVLPLPVVTITSNFSNVCENGSSTVTFTGTPNAIVTYTVNGGVTQTITLNASGTASVTNTYTITSIYTLIEITSSGSQTCTQQLNSTLTVSVIPFPEVTISSNVTAVCSGSSATVTFTGTPNTIVTYTINGGVNQTIPLDLSGIASITNSYSGTTTYNLISIATTTVPTCSQLQNGSVTITVTQAPIPGDSSSVVFCVNSPMTDLFTLLGVSAQVGGTWFPVLASGTGVFDPSVDISGIYSYTILGTSPCPDGIATVTVTVNPIPNAGDNSNSNICSNSNPQDLFLLLGASAQTGGTWFPTLASVTGVFDPTVDGAGNYTYTVLGTPPCLDDTAIVTVTVTPGPEAGLDGNLVVCLDSASQNLFNSLGGSPQIGGTWSPDLASGTGIFNPAIDIAGIYTYTFFGNQPCDNDTANVTVTVNPIPYAGTNGIKIFCTNDLPQDLFASLGGSPQLGGIWTPALSSTTGIFNPLVDVSGSYTYSVGGNLCSTATAVVDVTVYQSPNAGGLGATLLINTCSNIISVDLFTGLNGTQAAGTWNDDDVTGALTNAIFNPSITGLGTFHFTYTVGGGTAPCLFDTATVTVIVSLPPNAGTFLGNQNLCAAVGTFDITTLLSGQQPNGTWTDSNGLQVTPPIAINNFIAGTYSYTYTIYSVCGNDAEIVQFTILPNPQIISSNMSVPNVCLGAGATVNLSGMVDGTYALDYDLSGANTLGNQTVTVTIVGGNGSFSIPLESIPNLGTTVISITNIANSVSFCESTVSGVTATFVVNPLVQLDNANLSATNVCFGTNIQINISGASNLPDGVYQFNYTIPTAVPTTGNSGNVTITAGSGLFTVPSSLFTIAGIYSITITGITTASGCSNMNEDATASFEILPLPNVSGAVVSTETTCINFFNQVTISGANNLPDGIYTLSYELSGANIASTTVLVTFVNGITVITIPATDLTNIGNTIITINTLISSTTLCGASGNSFSPVEFSVVQLGIPVLNSNGNSFCEDDNPTIAALSANIQGNINIVWFNAATNGTSYSNTDLLQDGATYYASFVTASGCESPTRLEVTVDLTVCDNILIPDGFSPNGDGINDEFVIENLPIVYPNFGLEIYNRYGNLLYKGNNNNQNWNGTTSENGLNLGSNLLPTGVYFYILNFNDGVRKPVQGRVYLSR